MALPSSYLTSFKNVSAILAAIQQAQAPQKFTVKFLQDLGFGSSADRLIIKLLKTLNFLDESGVPRQRYHEFLDPSEAGRVMAEGVREAYADLFKINKDAQNMSAKEVQAKFKTISQGTYSDDVLGKMARTFSALATHADFSSSSTIPANQAVESDAEAFSGDDLSIDNVQVPMEQPQNAVPTPQRHVGGKSKFVYEISIHLPNTRDQSVYDAIFSSMKKHLDV